MTLPETALRTAVRVLTDLEVDYAVSGSFAAAYHGAVRATADADLKVQADDFRRRQTDVAAAMERNGFVALDATSFRLAARFDIELYPALDAIDVESMRRRVAVELFPESTEKYWIVTLEDLVLSKLREFAKYGDHKHLDDIKRLLIVGRAALDVDYLADRVDKHGYARLWSAHIEPGPTTPA